MEANARIVWLDSQSAVDPTQAGALCRRHADAMRPPIGWILEDRRPDGDDLQKRSTDDSLDVIDPIVSTVSDDDTASDEDTGADDASIDLEIRELVYDGVDGEDADDMTDGFTDDITDDFDTEIDLDASDTVDLETPDETKGTPWVPRLGQDGNDAPDGRLLGRAFGRRED